MAIILNTITEALEFLDGFDGHGMISTDEFYQVGKLRECNLIDDYKENISTECECGHEFEWHVGVRDCKVKDCKCRGFYAK